MHKHNHTIHQHQCHFGWNNDNPPVVTDRAGRDGRVPSGRSPRAASSPRNRPWPTSPALDFAKVNPVAGPVYVDGAEPGDAIKVTLLAFHALGLGLDRQHSGLRPSRRPIQGAGAAYLEI